ncbi:MAG: hypothetical protein ACR2Q4_20975 [Geminicoccaceae bacterium]
MSDKLNSRCSTLSKHPDNSDKAPMECRPTISLLDIGSASIPHRKQGLAQIVQVAAILNIMSPKIDKMQDIDGINERLLGGSS